MKILFGTDNFYRNVSGAATFAYELAKGLAKNGHDISVIAPSIKFKHTVDKHEGMTIYGIPSVMIPKIIHPAGVRVSLPLTVNSTKKLIAKIDPEVVHIHDHYPMIGSKVASAGKKLNLPVVGTNHFMPENFIHYLLPPDFVKEPLSKLAWRQFINVYKHLNLVTTPTKTAARLIHNLGLKNPIIPISCGVDLNRFNPRNSGSYLKKRYKINSSKLVVLFVGRLDKEKNIDVVIKAFPVVLKSIDAQLIIAGKGKEKTNLVNLSKNLGLDKNITFTGFVTEKDLPNLFRMADVFVIASIAELQSIATMEAMASGLPVVAARVMALPELVHDGKNGYLFSDGDTNALANQMIKILKNPALRKKMSANSLKIISRHDLKNTITSYEKLYQKLISASKA